VCSPIYAAYFAQLYWDSNRITGNSYKQYSIYFAYGDQYSLNTDKVFFSFIQNRTVLNMKNKEFYKLLKKSHSKFNSGFTLTELLIGLVMSTIVVAGLGWGLMQMLTTTQRETTRVSSRNETSRAFGFISDEVKAAQTIEVDMSSGNISTVAPNFTLPTGGTVRLALQVPGVDERIIYYVAPPTATWNGPLVIYRWGPGLDANGSYIAATSPSQQRVNNPNGWEREALIDGISDVNQTVDCDNDGDGTAESIGYQGFFACVVDDDNDGITENNATADLNGDGVVDAGDGADNDGLSITAQLFFAADTENGVYTTDSQIVARARVAPLRKPELREPEPVYFESLNPQYGRPGCWTVRNDFGIGKDPRFDPNETSPHADALSEILTWVHADNRQPQPLNIDTTKPFTMVASAYGGVNGDGSENSECLARGNKYKQKLVSISDDGSNPIYGNIDESGNDVDEDNKVKADGKEEIHTYENKVWHTIEFPEGGDDAAEIARKEATYNGAEADNADVKGDGTVYMFKADSTIPDVGGYDANDNGIIETAAGDQPSLREFLRDPNQDGDNSDAYVNADGSIISGKLKDNQRIVVFEIGQTVPGTDADPNPGFDLQDNMFIMTSDAFLSN